MLIYYYGDGKGKTTAALGTVLRAAGYGWPCLVIQAIKGNWPTGEAKLIGATKIPNVSIVSAGLGFIGICKDNKKRSEHVVAARGALEKARQAIASRRWRLIVLDEFGDLGELDNRLNEQLMRIIESRVSKPNIIITGHRYHRSIAQAADIVTKMAKIKHRYDCGIMAERGIDY